MAITAFQVRSNRIHDINLPDGTTVGKLKEILQGAGYDVNAALISVNRFAESDTLIGQVEQYVLKTGDTVEFKTEKIDMPATRNAVQAIVNEAAAAPKATASKPAAPCCSCGCKQRESAPQRGVVLHADGNVEIVQIPEGLLIKVRG